MVVDAVVDSVGVDDMPSIGEDVVVLTGGTTAGALDICPTVTGVLNT